ELLANSPATAIYKGLALATIATDAYLYAADFHNSAINVFKGNAASPNLAGNFVDPTLPAGYAPFNVQMLNGRVYVAYAQQDPAAHDEVTGPGRGYVSEFTLQG